MNEAYKSKYLKWQGKCGAYAKHHGKDSKLDRMNNIKKEYFKMWFGKEYPYSI